MAGDIPVYIYNGSYTCISILEMNCILDDPWPYNLYVLQSKDPDVVIQGLPMEQFNKPNARNEADFNLEQRGPIILAGN